MSLTVDMNALQSSFLQLAMAINSRITAVELDQDAETLGGMTKEQIIEAIVGQQGLTLGDVLGQLNAFIERRDNPHEVTKEQVGLGLVEDKAIMSQAEATAVGVKSYEKTPDEAVSKYVDGPALAYALGSFWAQTVGAAPEVLNDIHELAEAISANQDLISVIQENATTKVDIADFNTAVSSLQDAINDLTKADVGLADVENLGVASLVEMSAAEPSRKYMSTDVFKLFIDTFSVNLRNDITEEIENAIAGLATTKEDVGLGLVNNAGWATEVQAADADNASVYMNPARTHQVTSAAIDAYHTNTVVPAFNALKVSIDDAIVIVSPDDPD